MPEQFLTTEEIINKVVAMGYTGSRLHKKVKDEIKMQDSRRSAVTHVPVTGMVRGACMVQKHVAMVGNEQGLFKSQVDPIPPAPIKRSSVTGNALTQAEFAELTAQIRSEKVDAIIAQQNKYYGII